MGVLFSNNTVRDNGSETIMVINPLSHIISDGFFDHALENDPKQS